MGMGWDGNLCLGLFYEHRFAVLKDLGTICNVIVVFVNVDLCVVESDKKFLLVQVG